MPDAGTPIADVDDPSLYLNRELSWLEFNRKVLALAGDTSVPLLERVRYIAIFHANLDEFFMVRVAGLKRQVQAGVTEPTADGRTPAAALQDISARLRPMLSTAMTTVHEQLFRLLRRHGVAVVSMADLAVHQRAAAAAYFEHEVFPVLTPLAVDPGHPFPYLSNLSISLAVTVRDPRRQLTRFARVKVPKVLPRFVPLDGGIVFVPLEDLIRSHLDRLFPGLEVVASHPFRVTRNADLELEEEGADDLLMAIEEELRKRRFGAVVRLEVDSAVPDTVTSLLQGELNVTEFETYHVSGLLGCDDLVELADLDRPRLRWRSWHPVTHPRLRSGPTGTAPDVFAAIREGDLLVHHPYTSFGQSVERFILQASEDPDVLAIKQTLYRTSGDSPIVDALIHAAERGTQVVALVELKARFDEEANIVWARSLESAGVHVVYGLLGLKTHAKTALVVRRERDGIRRYVHIGTGNYNSRTARVYTDLGLLSCDPALGADLTELFNALTGYGRQVRFRKLLVAPWRMRERVSELIEREIAVHRAGQRQGLIRMQLNALIDKEMISALYAASRAGVQIRLVVRDICGLRPGIPDVSEHIEVRSVVGRFLEHARILQFGPDDVLIGSADLMPRNLDRRVEVLVPIEDPELRTQLRGLFDTLLEDNTMAWRLGAGGSWTRIRPRQHEPGCTAQEQFMERARSAGAGTAST
ncbi:MAG: polyphosphate kinase 1 [Actinobacteria bacterium]|nr:polyphosphate kinase 1 [Actinomycetota bacterium]